ncbi:MAG: phosphohydrolase, partial [Croceitalea sp.]|nr:phosphohydrolase [Croceitalea sp.]
VSSQLDMDRLDYLKRDSFFTGVHEGNINSERLLTMLNVSNNELVIEEKGLYSVEKFLMARRFMYWQVYLHKTSLVAEQLLIKVIDRAKGLMKSGKEIEASPTLLYFLKADGHSEFTLESLNTFALLDDIDIISALKIWQNNNDIILAKLSTMLLNRELLHIKIKNKPLSKTKIAGKKEWVKKHFQLTDHEASYFVFEGVISNQAYDEIKGNINILHKNGKLTDVATASDHFNLKALSTPVTKYYACYPKDSV